MIVFDGMGATRPVDPGGPGRQRWVIPAVAGLVGFDFFLVPAVALGPAVRYLHDFGTSTFSSNDQIRVYFSLHVFL